MVRSLIIPPRLCDRMPDLLDHNSRIWRSEGGPHESQRCDQLLPCIGEIHFLVYHSGEASTDRDLGGRSAIISKDVEGQLLITATLHNRP